MWFENSRESLRRQWLEAWRKGQTGAILSPLEDSLVKLVSEHPEYHAWLEGGETVVNADFSVVHGQTNPFLHLSMHLALREQISTNRPAGIERIHQRLAHRLGSAHEAEHRMMDPLGRALWEAQRAGVAPDEQRYLDELARL